MILLLPSRQVQIKVHWTLTVWMVSINCITIDFITITINFTLSFSTGANQVALGINGLDAISIAVNAANADIVTLLRLAKLNVEIKESEQGNPGND